VIVVDSSGWLEFLTDGVNAESTQIIFDSPQVWLRPRS